MAIGNNIKNAASNTTDAARKQAQLARYTSLCAVVNKANVQVNELKKINDDVQKAKQIIVSAKQLPNMVDKTLLLISQIQTELQNGVIINGKPAGQSLSSDISRLKSGIRNPANEIVTICETYINKKKGEADKINTLIEQYKHQYNNLKNGDLGSYRSRIPSFPDVSTLISAIHSAV